MAIRPVYSVILNNQFVEKKDTNFEYFNGFSEKQKRRCIKSLHQAYLEKNPLANILEISSKSENELGIKLSAFNLSATTLNGNSFSVECAFQSSKIFEKGGPFKDLLLVSSKMAKKDKRLKENGRLLGFYINKMNFPLEPKTYFYNWLYINALSTHSDLAHQIMQYDAFTDIEFNPKKSINCQAEAAAIFVSLKKQNLLDKALQNKETFLKIVYSENNKYGI